LVNIPNENVDLFLFLVLTPEPISNLTGQKADAIKILKNIAYDLGDDSMMYVGPLIIFKLGGASPIVSEVVHKHLGSQRENDLLGIGYTQNQNALMDNSAGLFH